MRLLPLLILLGFPVVEFVVTARIAQQTGWGLLSAWLALAALAGAALVREAGHSLEARLMRSLTSGESMLSAVLDSGRTFFAGLLLIFPGVVSDLLALALLMLPLRAPLRPRVAADGVMEGQYRRVDERL